MSQQSRWVRMSMTCPEGRGETRLLTEWKVKGDETALNGVSCSNSHLKDYGGEDCQWSCWEKIVTRKA
jgi:hypothetical protein